MKRRTFIGSLIGMWAFTKELFALDLVFTNNYAVFRKDNVPPDEARRLYHDRTTIKVNNREWMGHPDHTVLITNTNVSKADNRGLHTVFFTMAKKLNNGNLIVKRFTDFNQHTYGVQVE